MTSGQAYAAAIREVAQPLEAEVARLKAEAEDMRKAFRFIKEIGERDWSTRRLNTCEDRVRSMVKWANYGLAELPPASPPLTEEQAPGATR